MWDGIRSNGCERILDLKVGMLSNPNPKPNAVDFQDIASRPGQCPYEESGCDNANDKPEPFRATVRTDARWFWLRAHFCETIT